MKATSECRRVSKQLKSFVRPPNKAPIDLRVNFLRPVPPDGRRLVATAEVAHRTRSIAYTRSDVHNEDGKVVALATATALYR